MNRIRAGMIVVFAIGLTIFVAQAAFASLTGASSASDASKAPDYASDIVPGEVIVQYDSSSTADDRSEARDEVDADIKKTLALPKTQLLKLEPGTKVADAISELEDQPGVKFAEPNYRLRPTAIPNDPKFPDLWSLDSPNDAGDIDAPEAWDTTKGTAATKIMVIDDGVEYTHSDLAANIWSNPGESGAKATNGLDDDGNGKIDDLHGWDYANNDGNPLPDGGPHGTQVAGTIGGVGNNGIGVTGVNWTTSIIGYRYDFTSASVVDAAAYAGKVGAHIVNMSFIGGPSETMLDAISRQPNTLFVAAAGNDGYNHDAPGVAQGYPCAIPTRNVICVAATDSNGDLADYSAYGQQSVDLAAPSGTWTTYLGNDYSGFGGTSQATPVVAGVLGLLKSFRPSADTVELRAALLGGVRNQPWLSDKVFSSGIVNARGSLAALGSSGAQITASQNSGPLTVGSAPGVASDLTVTFDGGLSARVHDASATVAAGNNCVQDGTDAVCDLGYASARISTSDGNDRITIVGAISTEINGGSGNDTVIGGSGQDRITGGLGADTLRGGDGAGDSADYSDHTTGVTVALNQTPTSGTTGGNEGDDVGTDVEQLVGTGYNDVLTGSASNNIIDAQSGTNQINGGAGNDTFRAGYANDTFNGGDGVDAVDYSNHSVYQVFATLGTSGNGSVQLAESDTIGADVEGLTGTIANDTLTGNAGSGNFNGGYGDDTIEPGLGADSVNGGRGIDSVSYGARTSGVSVDTTVALGDGQAGEGDNIQSSVETIYGTEFADTLIGGVGDNKLIPGLGKDVIKGGLGRDTVAYDAHPSAVSLSNDGSANDGSTNEQDNIDPDIEVLQGSNFNDTITGGVGADTLMGSGGVDTLSGNDGNDVFVGGPGTDLYNGGAGSDIVSYEDGTNYTPVQASLDGNPNDGFAGENENIGSTIEGLIGSPTQDTLTGNGSDNRISGSLGTDTIDGGGGNDELNGDDPAVALNDSQGQIGCAMTEMGDTDTIHGGDGNDLIRGYGYKDHIYGDNGDDTFFGGGSNVYTRTDGRDACIGNNSVGFGNDGYGDDFHGGAGTDTVDYSVVNYFPTNYYPNPQGVTVSLDDVANDGVPLEYGGYENDNAGKDVENVTGSNFIDTITGDEDANVLDGGSQNDVVNGEAGADTLIGGSGDDTLNDFTDQGPDTARCGEGSGDYARLNVGDTPFDCENVTYAAGVIDTILDSRPPDFTRDNTLDFTFHASAPAAGFQCKIDSGIWSDCTSPWATPALGEGAHLIYISAYTQTVSDPTPLNYSITVDTIAPDTTFTSGPAEGSTVPAGDQQFGFSSSETNSTFEFRVDGGAWSSATSPKTVSGLTAGSHQVQARATDRAGNVDGSPATRNFTIGSEGAAALTVGAPVAPAASVALSTEGSYDWAHWGATAANSFNVRGTSPGDRISNYSLTGSGGTVTRATFTSPAFTWSGGSPTATGNTGSGIYIGGAQNRGFAITAPATNGQARVLKLYVAAQNTTGGLTFSMADGSVNASAASLAVGSTLTHRVYTVTYRSNSATSNLRAEWKQTTTASSGRVYLEAATVAPVSDLTPGDTSISSGPAEGSTITTPTTSFAFAISGDTASTVPGYLCKFDSAAYAPCTSPVTSPTLSNGSHTFSVKSVDQNGNVDSSPATRNFTVAIPPTKLQIGTISTTPSSVNLTSAGTAGWAHWGTSYQLFESSYFTPTRMNNVSASVISNVSKVGSSATAARVTSSVPSYSWSNGPSGSPSATALSIGGASGRGFRVTLAGASGAERTAYLYLGVINTTGKLDLSLSDGSAPAVSTTALTAGSTVAHYIVPVTYRATNGSATLSATIAQNTTASSGRVYLESVALAP